MSFADAETFLYDQIPTKYQVLIPPVLKRAHAAANMVMAKEPMFQVPSAKDDAGRFVSWAVDFGIQKLIESGEWPVDFAWRDYGLVDRRTKQVTTATGQYLEVMCSHARVTISQVADPRRQPRNVKFRENARLINEPFLRGLDIPDQEVAGVPTFILIYGHQNLTFAHLGVPHSHHARRWAYRTDNLMLLPQAVPSDTAPIEKTDFNDDVMTLKQDIDKWRRDNG